MKIYFNMQKIYFMWKKKTCLSQHHELLSFMAMGGEMDWAWKHNGHM